MALPTQPPITMHQICDEFGVPRNTPLASFLRGAGIVPNTPTNAGVPTTLPIDMLQLLGAANFVPLSVSANNVFAREQTAGPGTVSGFSTATASGGTGTYSYLWTLVDGPALLKGPATGATAEFSRFFSGSSGDVSATYRVTVTSGSESVSRDISVRLIIGTLT